MKPSNVPSPTGVSTFGRTQSHPVAPAEGATPLVVQLPAERYYRRIRRDLEPFFRRLEKPFSGRE